MTTPTSTRACNVVSPPTRATCQSRVMMWRDFPELTPLRKALHQWTRSRTGPAALALCMSTFRMNERTSERINKEWMKERNVLFQIYGINTSHVNYTVLTLNCFINQQRFRQVKIFYTITIYESLHTYNYMHTPDTFLLFYSQSIRNQRLNITSTNQ